MQIQDQAFAGLVSGSLAAYPRLVESIHLRQTDYGHCRRGGPAGITYSETSEDAIGIHSEFQGEDPLAQPFTWNVPTN